MAFSYDLSTDAGKVRLLVPDSNAQSYVFEDDEIEGLLGIEGTVKRAAALALETIAANEALVLKVITLLDLSTDGAKVADSLLKRANLLRDQDEQEGQIAGGFDIAEMVVDVFSARELLYRGYWP